MNDKYLEFIVWKKWNETMINLHWSVYRLESKIDNENTNLWKKLRREK
mgnify:CR=1 FL=1